MRLRSKWLLFALPVFAVAAGCSEEYDHVQNIKLDEVNPEFVLPLVNDKMGLEDVIQQVGDNAKIKFDQDGLAYMQYNRDIEFEDQIVPAETWQGEKNDIYFYPFDNPTLGLRERYVFVNVKPYGTLSQNPGPAASSPGKKNAPIRVKKAVLAASSTEVSLTLIPFPGTPSADITGCSLKGKLAIFGGQETEFTLPLNEKKDFVFNNVLNSKDYEINMAAGAELPCPFDKSKTYETFQTQPNAQGVAEPFSWGHSEIPLSFTDLKLVDASGNDVDDKGFGLNASFEMTFVKPTKLIGEIDEELLKNMKKEWTDVSRSISLFDNVYSADLALPKANLEVRVNKPKDLGAKLKINQMLAEYNGKTPTAAVVSMPITSTATGAGTLLVDNTDNVLAKGEAETTFTLKPENSNFGEAFTKGVKVVKVKTIEMAFDEITGSTGEIELPVAKSSIKLDVNIPFYGRAVSNKFVRTKEVDLSVVGKKYTDYLAGDDKAEIGQNGEAGVDGVTLLFRFKNGFPFDMYTTIEFLDEAKQSIMKLRLQAEDAQGSSNTIGVPLLMMAGKVSQPDGKVVSPVVTHAVAKLSRAEFKALQERAKYIRSEYAATTPGAGQKENVGIYKGYEIQVGIAVDIKGRLTFGK